MKQGISCSNSDAVLPSSSRSLTQTILSSRIDANDDIKPVVETIIYKGTAMRGTYEKFSLDGKAKVAKCTAEYRVSFTTVQHIVKILPDHPLKEGTFLVDRVCSVVSTAADNAPL